MALHLYGVTGSSARAPQVKGRGDVTVRLVAYEDLAVLVSEVDEQARAGAADLLAHARVLEAALDQATVIPMRFGMLLRDEDEVRRDVLAADHDRLAWLLQLFDGLVQVSVRVVQEEEPALREVLERRPDLRELRDQVRETVPPGGVSNSQLRLGESVTRALTDLAATHAASVTPRLSEAARATHLLEPQGVNEVLSGAFLVARDDRERFDRAVARLRHDYDGRLSVRYVGPQPPYAFIEEAQEGRTSWV